MSGCDPMPDPSIAVALLAAGRSRRFDGDKLTAQLAGDPLWHHAARAAERAGFQRRLLICRDGMQAAFAREGWTTIANPDADRGMATSIRAAVEACGPATRLVVMLADMPFVDASHLRMLAQAQETLFSRYPDGSSGVPAGFARADFASLASLDGQGGAQSLARAPGARSIAPENPIALKDIDTRLDLAEARGLPLSDPESGQPSSSA